MKTWYVDHPGQLFSLESPENKHYFFRTRGDQVTNKAVEEAMDKIVTKEKLNAADVPTPKSIEFQKDTAIEEIIKNAEAIGYPVVVKPIDGSFGRGVYTNIQDEKELREIITLIIEEAKENDFMLESHVTGKDYRLYIVNDEVVGAILRTPPHVIGDGINSIEALIAIKNNDSFLNPRLMDCLIHINNELVEFIGKNNFTLDAIPAEGELIYLSDKANVSIGGDPVGVLDELNLEVKKIAVEAVK